MNKQADIPFDNSFVRMPASFFARLNPTSVSRPAPIRVNGELAVALGIDPEWLASEDGTAVIAGNTIATGSEPLATVYAGHQFGSYNPQLGDGRAILLGEVIAADGDRYDIQLKGSGPTPYSRGGDGRSPLGPVLREYIVSESMYALGIPTTRALAAVSTGEQVRREQLLPGAILARVAHSHIRIGTFQYFAARGDLEALRNLVDHVAQRHYPTSAQADNPALAMLQAVIARQAALVAQWQLVGFIHGVMNTDNMLLCGETVDYGPCAFMDAYSVDTVFSSIDRNGRYAYGNQPAIANWNLARLAQALLPLLHADEEQAVSLAQAAIDGFEALFLDDYHRGLRRKLGLSAIAQAGAGLDDAKLQEPELAEELFHLMAQEKTDFTLCFRYLTDLARPGGPEARGVADIFQLPSTFNHWLQRWREQFNNDGGDPAERYSAMHRANPVYIPRNHLVQAAITAAHGNDLQPFHRLVDRLAAPFDYNPADHLYALPARPEEQVLETFCGT